VLLLPAKAILLSYIEGKHGFDILGLQKSAYFNGRAIEDIAFHSINPHDERGGHFHKRKTEWLMPISGKALLIWTDKPNPRAADLKHLEIVANYAEPILIEITPSTIHWVKNESPQPFIMVALSTENYNPQQPDTYKIELPK
jgi:dTDP-4-dehydrorhamnose 3,5-epimerase-like enzyme